MKKIKVILIVFILKSLLVNSQDKEFVKILGKENIRTLNLMLNDFENNILKTKYPDIKIRDAYQVLLTEITKEKIISEKTRSKKIKNLFDKSNLKRHIYCIPDSVYLGTSKYNLKSDKKAVITEYKCLKSDNEIIETRSEFYWNKNRKNIEKTLEDARNSDQLNLAGLFLKALKSTKNKTAYLKNYIDSAESMGDIRHPILMSQILLDKKADLTDYIIKRLILVNIIYRY